MYSLDKVGIGGTRGFSSLSTARPLNSLIRPLFLCFNAFPEVPPELEGTPGDFGPLPAPMIDCTAVLALALALIERPLVLDGITILSGLCVSFSASSLVSGTVAE